MSRFVLRTALLLAVTAIVFSPAASFGIGPGGRGGPGAGGAAGGPGGYKREPGKKEIKKGDGPQTTLGATGLSNKFGGAKQLSGGPQNLNGKFQNLPGGTGKLSSGSFDPTKFSPFDQRPGDNQNQQVRDGQHRRAAQSAANDFSRGSQPFSPQWFAEHPNAWQDTHPHADAWAAATATGVAAWLGWGTYDNAGYGTSYSTTNVYEQPSEDTNGTSDNVSTADSSTDEAVAADEAAATDEDSGEWLALGIYAVESANGEPTSRFLQLTVNRQGEIRGVYYDEISGSSQNLSGEVDESTHIATWSPDSNRDVTFRASLSDLTQARGTIEVTRPAGKQTWHVTRQQNST